MTVSHFEALEQQIPATEAQQALRLAMIAVYPHAPREGAERMWQAWESAAYPPKSFSAPVSGALFSLNGRPVSIDELRAGLGAALGSGLVA